MKYSVKYINLNDFDIRQKYDEFVRDMHEYAVALDACRMTNYTEEVERGELAVTEFLSVMHYGDMAYMEWNDNGGVYAIAPFTVLTNNTGDITNVYVFHNFTKEEQTQFEHFSGWLEKCEYNIKDNIVKLSDNDGVTLVQNRKSAIIYNNDIYKID